MSHEYLMNLHVSYACSVPKCMRDDDDLDDVEEEDNPDDMPYVCAKIPILGTGAQ